jgi:hypothetical protein
MVLGLKLRVWGVCLGYKVQDLGYRFLLGLGYRVQGIGFRVQGVGLKLCVKGCGSRV